MEQKIEFVPSAFRHHIAKEDIRWALNNHITDSIVEEGDETTRIAVGFDRVANLLLEVMYHELEDETPRNDTSHIKNPTATVKKRRIIPISERIARERWFSADWEKFI